MKYLPTFSIVFLILIACQKGDPPPPTDPSFAVRKIKRFINPNSNDTVDYTYMGDNLILENSLGGLIIKYSYDNIGKLESQRISWDGSFDTWLGERISNDTIYADAFDGVKYYGGFHGIIKRFDNGKRWTRIDSAHCYPNPPSTLTNTWKYDESGNLISWTNSTCNGIATTIYKSEDSIPNPWYSTKSSSFIPFQGPNIKWDSMDLISFRYEYILDEQGYPIEILKEQIPSGNLNTIFKIEYFH